MNFSLLQFINKKFAAMIRKYDHEKYWKMRSEVVNPNSKVHKLIRYIYLYRIKKSDAFCNAQMATTMGRGAEFAEPPILPHGLNGIFVSFTAKIGKNVTIFHQVTIMEGPPGFPIIGDNCFIGTGAKIFGNVVIGDNVKIGANAVVTKNIKSNTTAVGVPAKVVRTHV